MQMKNQSKRRLQRVISLLLVLMLLPFNAGIAFADESENNSISADPGIVAEWTFNDNGDDGIIPATGGEYKPASMFKNVGGTFEDYSDSDTALSYQGWNGEKDTKYWLATLSTKGFNHITLSSQQNSSGSGPRDFKVQTSTDKQNWVDVPNTDLVMAKSSFDCPDNTCKLDNVSLPNADDQALLYIRWIVRSDVNTNGEEGSIGGGGSSRIKDIRISGDRIPGADLVIPTIDTAEYPRDGALKSAVDAMVSVKFNKDIEFDNQEHSVVIKDEENNALNNVQVEIAEKNTLQINHPPFAYGKSYKVTIPKELIKGIDGIPLVRNIEWSFAVQDSPYLPASINMTFNGDPKTSISLAWYTDVVTDTVLQVVDGSKMTGSEFPVQNVTEFTGTEVEIETFVSKSDRTTNKKTKFISHKVTANNLTPGTTYKYRVGNGSTEGWSETGSFTTDTMDNQSFRFIVGSDSQASSKDDFMPWADTFDKAKAHIGDPKFLISAGDLVDNGDLEEQWQWMLGLAQNDLLNVPYVPVLGGHEVMDYDGDETTPNNNFYNHFNLPQQVVAGTDEGSVYTFEYGDALYLVFNSQYAGGLNEKGTIDWEDEQFKDQVAWMKNVVAKSDKKWKFVTFHKSPYAAGDNSAQWEDDRIQFYKKYLIPAFDEMGIDMVFEAHDHMYMRSFQMYNDEIIKDFELDNDGNAINPKGTIYLMSNAFGNKFYYKNNQYYLDEDYEPHEILDADGNPIPYDDYFAAIDEQPEKKMFADVSITDQVLSFTAYTAAKEDEGKAGTVGNGLFAYDDYGIKRTDRKPAIVENANAHLSGNSAIISWQMPSESEEPVRGYRIYEKNDNVKTHWSEYIPAVAGQTAYSYKIENINPAKKYNIIIKAVGTRMNSGPVEVTTSEGPATNEPPSAPTKLQGKAVSPYQINLTWTASSGTVQPTGYNVYQSGNKIASTTETLYINIGLNPNTPYSYSIKAYNVEGIESLVSNTIQVSTKQIPTSNGPNKAFPQHSSYVGNAIKPNHLKQTELDATVTRLYDEWKVKYLKQNPYDPNQYYVWYSDGDWFEEEDISITVSEAHGYGMMITAMMAGHDPNAKTYFDGLYRYFRAHPSEINPNLMAWKQGDNGVSIVDIEGADSATDGDLDIAYSLLLANSQWGNGGEINYLSQAKTVIGAIMESDVNQSEWVLRIADWATDVEHANATRPSDFMLQHLKDFNNVTGDGKWKRVIDKTYDTINSLYKNYSPNAGLLPDFAVKNGDSFVPAEPYFLESDFDGDYNYNASRTPWRIGTDYLVTGDTRAIDQLGTMNSWIREKTNNDPSQIRAGYKLDGSEALAEYGDITFSAPLMVSAMIDSSNQEWLNKLWDYNAAVSTEEDVYFGNNLRLLTMIVVSGNWWTPTIVDSEAPLVPAIERAEAVNSSEIDLKWTPSSDNMAVAGYKLYRDDVEISTQTKTEYRDRGLTPNTTYKYYVIAFDAAGNHSKISNVRMVTTTRATSEGGGNESGSDGSGSGSGSTNPTKPVVTPTPNPVTKKTFTDVTDQYSWAKNAIEELAAKGIIVGTSETTFEPGKKMTRADFIILLVKLLGLKTDFDTNFADVDQSSYYYEAIGIARRFGLVAGIGDDKFDPKAEISRQDMIVLVARALKQAGKLTSGGTAADLSKFVDGVEVADYALEGVAALVNEGIVQGDGHAIHLKDSATRAEVAVIIYQIFKQYRL